MSLRWPIFTFGKGKLTSTVLNTMMDQHKWIEANRGQIEASLERKKEPLVQTWFWAKITDFVAIAGTLNRWRYAWEQMVFDDTVDSKTDVMSTKTNGLTGTTTVDYALNMAEASPTEDNRNQQPVQDDIIVRMWFFRDDDGALRYAFDRSSENGGFWVLITGYAVIGGETNKWAYAWKEAIWDESEEEFIAKTSGRSGTTGADPAYNSIETANQGTGVESGGVDVDGADYPAGFSLQPLQGTSSTSWTDALSPCVFLRPLWGDAATPGRVWMFEYANAHDGTC